MHTISAEEIKHLLGLKQHPTCGCVHKSFRSSRLISC